MKNCECGSGRGAEACCRVYLRGEALPATAEALMRSRYTAFACRDEGYLLQSWHSSTRPARLSLEGEPVRWTGLRIVAREAGGAADARGIVEFIASYTVEGEERTLHERSSFAREGGAWRYVQAEPRAKPGRNEPCPCGSGKKYKACCGR